VSIASRGGGMTIVERMTRKGPIIEGDGHLDPLCPSCHLAATSQEGGHTIVSQSGLTEYDSVEVHVKPRSLRVPALVDLIAHVYPRLLLLGEPEDVTLLRWQPPCAHGERGTRQRDAVGVMTVGSCGHASQGFFSLGCKNLAVRHRVMGPCQRPLDSRWGRRGCRSSSTAPGTQLPQPRGPRIRPRAGVGWMGRSVRSIVCPWAVRATQTPARDSSPD
jgi:hypothetical protein